MSWAWMVTFKNVLTCIVRTTPAIKQARQLVDGHDVELWQLDRMVDTFKHSPERLFRWPLR